MPHPLNLGNAPHDTDDIQDFWYALEESGALDPDGEGWTVSGATAQKAPAYSHTPYGATKTAELDVQFSMDPSFGLTKERYGWYSDRVLFDSSNFDESVSRLDISTKAQADSSARIRSAYPGQYVSHTVAEPGLGAEIDSSNIQRDSNNLVSLTHGEISFELGSIDTDTNTGINAHGISYESDGTYHQVRVDGSDVARVPQEEWNIDTMDGSEDVDNPSGETLRPEGGYIYQFIYTWYGEGAMILAVQDPREGKLIPLNQYVPNSPQKPAVSSPNLPVQALIENQGTAEQLRFRLGGMQFATHGSGVEENTTRTTEVSRHTPAGFIDTNVTLSSETVDPYGTTLVPLIAARRNSVPEVEYGLRFNVDNVLVDADSPLYAFIFDEFDVAGSGLDGTFTFPTSRNPNDTSESNLQINTDCTTYSPTQSSVLRGFSYIPSSKNDPALVTTGDSSSRVPLESTAVIAAALAPGANSTTADPVVIPFREGF